MEMSNVSCREIEVFAALQSPLIGGWPAAHALMATKSVWLYNVLFFLADTRRASARISYIVYRRAKDRIKSILQDIEPDVVVATAPFISEVVAQARNDLQADFRIVNVVSDLVTPHASWACLEADLTIVCSKFAKSRMLSFGIHEERIAATSFPVHRLFNERVDGKIHFRNKLGLDAGRFTITLSGGGLGAGPILSSAKALSKAFHEAQLLIVAGRNEHLYQVLQSRIRGKHVRIYRFTDQMPDLIHASDVIVSKGGPSSIMEACAAKRPVIVIGEVGKQERGNGRFIQDLGIGFYARSANRMISIIDSLGSNYEWTGKLDHAYLVNGSREIANLVLEPSGF
jgi:1,2-diacylglycerol 3-beta-galactosyltransferase